MQRFRARTLMLIGIGLGCAVLPACSREQPIARNDSEKKSQPTAAGSALKLAPATAVSPPPVIQVGPPMTERRRLEVIDTGATGGRTKAKYDTVKKGMTRAQVEAAHGKGTVISIDEADRLITLGGIERSMMQPLTFVRWGVHPDPALIDSLVVGFSNDGKARVKGYRSQDPVSGGGSFEPLCHFVKIEGVVHYFDLEPR